MIVSAGYHIDKRLQQIRKNLKQLDLKQKLSQLILKKVVTVVMKFLRLRMMVTGLLKLIPLHDWWERAVNTQNIKSAY